MSKREIIYVALTTVNSQTSGWTCIAAGNDAQKVEDAANEMIKGDDIYAETERKNLVVVSRRNARRFGFNWNTFQPLPAEFGGRYQWVS